MNQKEKTQSCMFIPLQHFTKNHFLIGYEPERESLCRRARTCWCLSIWPTPISLRSKDNSLADFQKVKNSSFSESILKHIGIQPKKQVNLNSASLKWQLVKWRATVIEKKPGHWLASNFFFLWQMMLFCSVVF